MIFGRRPTYYSLDEKSRTYLGAVSVKPRKDVWWIIESMSDTNHGQIRTSLKRGLRDIFALPDVESIDKPGNKDLRLDLVVSHYSTGAFLTLSGDRIVIPIFRRPVITLTGVLYHIDNKAVVKAISVKQRARWREFFAHAFSRLFESSSLFGEAQMLVLLNRASLRLLRELAQ